VLHLFVEGEVTEATYADRINELGRERRFHLKVQERSSGGKPRDLVDAAIRLRTEELPRARDRRDPRREPRSGACLTVTSTVRLTRPSPTRPGTAFGLRSPIPASSCGCCRTSNRSRRR